MLLGRFPVNISNSSCPRDDDIRAFFGGLLAGPARRASRPSGDTEIEDFRIAFRSHDDRVRAKVAVNDIRRVRVGQGIRNLGGEINRTPGIHRQTGDHAFQRLARSKLENKKRLAVLIADLVERGDIRVR